jgi:hypothetical protein
LIVGALGLTGVTGREWWVYHVNTIALVSSYTVAEVRWGVPLCPNLVGSLEAPTTAKYGAEKKVRAAASVAILSL